MQTVSNDTSMHACTCDSTTTEPCRAVIHYQRPRDELQGIYNRHQRRAAAKKMKKLRKTTP